MGSPVNIQIRPQKGAIPILKQLTEEAILRALDRTVARLAEEAEGMGSRVPIRTGALRYGVVLAASPRTIIMNWSATDPRSGYDYAKVQDEGRSNMPGKFYSEYYRGRAKTIIMEELYFELASIGSVP